MRSRVRARRPGRACRGASTVETVQFSLEITSTARQGVCIPLANLVQGLQGLAREKMSKIVQNLLLQIWSVPEDECCYLSSFFRTISVDAGAAISRSPFLISITRASPGNPRARQHFVGRGRRADSDVLTRCHAFQGGCVQWRRSRRIASAERFRPSSVRLVAV